MRLCEESKVKFPHARQLAKVHKRVFSTRLIVAATSWVTTPAAVYLASVLQPIVDHFDLGGLLLDVQVNRKQVRVGKEVGVAIPCVLVLECHG